MPSDKVTLHILKDDNAKQVVIAWWKSLRKDPQKGAQLSALCRCTTIGEALFTQAFHELWGELRLTSQATPSEMRAWAAAAMCIAQMKEHTEAPVSRRFGLKSNRNHYELVSPIRFNQLVQSPTLDTLVFRMRRALKLIDQKGSVLSVADHILHWNKENQGVVNINPLHRFATSMALNYQDA